MFKADGDPLVESRIGWLIEFFRILVRLLRFFLFWCTQVWFCRTITWCKGKGFGGLNLKTILCKKLEVMSYLLIWDGIRVNMWVLIHPMHFVLFAHVPHRASCLSILVALLSNLRISSCLRIEPICNLKTFLFFYPQLYGLRIWLVTDQC